MNKYVGSLLLSLVMIGFIEAMDQPFHFVKINANAQSRTVEVIIRNGKAPYTFILDEGFNQAKREETSNDTGHIFSDVFIGFHTIKVLSADSASIIRSFSMLNEDWPSSNPGGY